jgi:chromosome segregation ATPase
MTVTRKPSRDERRKSKTIEVILPTIEEWKPNSPSLSYSDSLADSRNGEIDMLQQEQARLLHRLSGLQKEVNEGRMESDILKMKETITLGNMTLQIESLEEDKQCLTEKCEEFEQNFFELQIEQVSKQNKIKSLQQEADQRANSNTTNGEKAPSL